MKKTALLDEALDSYAEFQHKHPLAHMGIGLAGMGIPNFHLAMAVPNIVREFRRNRPISGLGQAASTAIGLHPDLHGGVRLLGAMGAGIGGSVLQQQADALKASHGDNLMNDKMAVLAAALPAAKTLGMAALGGAAATGGGVLASKAIEKATTPKDTAPPPSEPKLAFIRHLKNIKQAEGALQHIPVQTIGGGAGGAAGDAHPWLHSRLSKALQMSGLLAGVGGASGVAAGAGHGIGNAINDRIVNDGERSEGIGKSMLRGAGYGIAGGAGAGLGLFGGYALGKATQPSYSNPVMQHVMRGNDFNRLKAFTLAGGGLGYIGGALGAHAAMPTEAPDAIKRRTARDVEDYKKSHSKKGSVKQAAPGQKQHDLPFPEDPTMFDKMKDVAGKGWDNYGQPAVDAVKGRWDQLHPSVQDPLTAGAAGLGAAGIGAATGGAVKRPVLGALGGLAGGIGSHMLAQRLGLGSAGSLGAGAAGSALGGVAAGGLGNLLLGAPHEKQSSALLPVHIRIALFSKLQ